MDANCLKFMEAEISKTLEQKDYGIVNCWLLLKGKKDLTKVSLSWPFKRNPRDMTGTQKPSDPCPSHYAERSWPDHFGTRIWVFAIGEYGCMNAKTIGETSSIF